jgi:putative ABC transport system permease protein
MLRLAFKNVKHNPKRLILTAIAVALGVSLVSATLTFTHSLSSGFSSLFEEIYQSVDVVVETDPDGDLSPMSPVGAFSDADLEAIRAVDDVEAAEGGIGIETLFILNADREAPLNSSGAPTLIYNWTGNAEVDRSTIVDGRAPETAGEVVVDIDTFTAGGFALGDQIAIAAEEGVESFDLVGTITFGENNELQTANLLYMPEDSLRELGGGIEGWQTVEVITAEGADNAAVAASIGELLPEETRAVTSQQKAQEESEAFDEVLQYVDIFALAFAVIALFVGSYIIVNTFRIIVTQRTREFGLLRAIGVTGKQIRSVILLEGSLVGLVASTIGILSGWLLALAITAILEAMSGDIFATVVLPLNAIIAGFGVGMVVTMVSALLPAIHASTISPMEALRESATQSKKSLTLRNIVGGALTLLGALGVGIGLFTGIERPYIAVGAGAMVLLIGVTLLAAQVLVPIAFGLRGSLTSMFGVDGKLAANNIHREPRRSANTAAALMIGVMLLALVATFTESLKSTFTDQFETNEAELFLLAMQSPIPQGAIDVIADTEGVQTVGRLGFGEVKHDGVNRSLGQLDADDLEGLFEFPTDRPMSDLGDGVFIDPSMVAVGLDVGDTVTLDGDHGSVDLTVTGLYEVEGDANFFVNWDTGSELIADTFIVQAMVDFEDGADADVVRERIDEQLSTDFPLVSVQSPDELAQFFNGFIDTLLAVISALLASALVIAILGVANTLLLSVTERTREIGLLRAVGLRKRSVWRMITIESMVMAIFGTILGIILGVSLGSALVWSLEDFGFSGVTVPWAWLGLYTILAALAGVLAAIWPARRASKLDILQAIATE